MTALDAAGADQEQDLHARVRGGRRSSSVGRHRPGSLYHSPEALYLALAALALATPSLSGWMEARLAPHPGLGQFQRERLRSRTSYPSAAHWNRYGGLGLYTSGGKNGFSTHAAQALEMLMWIRARELLVEAAARQR